MALTPPARPRLLFFSRGRGRGHAIPDLAVIRQLVACSNLDVRVASYASGASVFTEASYDVIDLALPDDAPYLDVLIRATQAIATVSPAFVVSHEEFAALPAAKAFGLPTTLILDFFVPHELWKDSLRYADEILFIERRGIFAEPAEAQGKVRYLGPMRRPLPFTSDDRDSCRRALGWPPNAIVVSVIPGAWATEQRAPLADLVVPAFTRMPEPGKLVWVAGRDQDVLRARAAGCGDVLVIPEHSPIEQLMVASDVVVTKANRGTTLDAASLGVPTVSLSYGLNPVDDAIVCRIPTNTALHAKGVDPAFLSEVLANAVSRRSAPAHHEQVLRGDDTAVVASALTTWCARMLPSALVSKRGVPASAAP